MSRLTTNYGFNISEGNDPVNPLVDIFPNWEAIDTDLKNVSNASIGTATEITTGTVHALSRSDTDKNVFAFIATSNFTSGDTFTLDGNQVSALTPDGQTLASGSYVIGATVLCALHDTLITVYVSPAKAKDADMLDGHDSTYYAKDSDLDTLGNTVGSISDKVGNAVLTTTAPDLSGAVNELDAIVTKSSTDVNLPNSWSVNDDGKVLFTRVAGVVYINFYHLKFLQVGSVSNLFTIPEGFRPRGTQYVTLTEIPTSGTRSITIELMANGTVNAVTRGIVGEPNFSGVKGFYIL